jgi:hypothetical protein
MRQTIATSAGIVALGTVLWILTGDHELFGVAVAVSIANVGMALRLRQQARRRSAKRRARPS